MRNRNKQSGAEQIGDPHPRGRFSRCRPAFEDSPSFDAVLGVFAVSALAVVATQNVSLEALAVFLQTAGFAAVTALCMPALSRLHRILHKQRHKINLPYCLGYVHVRKIPLPVVLG